MNIRVYFRNCLKSVILLWTGIIAFNASVTAYEVDGKDIRDIYVHYCGGLFRSLEVYYVDIRNEENQELFDNIYKTPDASVGPLRHLMVPFDDSPCNGMKHKFQKIEFPDMLMGSAINQLQIKPLEKEMSRK
ncbi:unnamed protein product [Macrosiphum euphorbiae]|uniref:Uncharacterized protein n=1 Tax=Macrosiphum euphorbiae TaxID=13131 RepID=A0AAV0WNC2_9HEMI|nr:unnamed protein product [Macrosiphum euphorbiae]